MLEWYQASCCVVSKGVSEIGIKQRYLEWARLEGRNPGHHQLRVVVGLQDFPEHTRRWLSRATVSIGGGYGGADTGFTWGSVALDLSECVYALPERDDSGSSFLGSASQVRPRGGGSNSYGKL